MIGKQGLIIMAVLFFLPLSIFGQDNLEEQLEKWEKTITTNGCFLHKKSMATYYLELSKKDRTTYVMGFVDGLALAPIMVYPPNKDYIFWFENLTKTGSTNIQVEAIVTKYVNDHPERWHQPLGYIIYSALFEAFKKPQ